MPITTALYAGLLGFVAIALGVQAGRLRARLNIAIGDGGNQELLLAMRRHANFAEWVPLALVLVLLMELNGASGFWLHLLGITLVAARCAHAFDLQADSMQGKGRALGAGGTLLVVLIASLWLICAWL